MHPNPDYTYRNIRRVEIDNSKDLLLQVEFFDATPELREAHLLAYLNRTRRRKHTFWKG
ncbi:MAG TPA: hypothetical protein VK638_43240 [Edaphobacter sp.]|nr:hypothetical protein [Edaphobacter sp.]